MFLWIWERFKNRIKYRLLNWLVKTIYWYWWSWVCFLIAIYVTSQSWFSHTIAWCIKCHTESTSFNAYSMDWSILVVYNYDKQYYNNFIVVPVDCVIIIASDFAIIALCKTIWMYILRNYCYFLICIHVLLYNHHILFIYLLKIECSEVFSENTVDHIEDINWSGDTLHRTTQ